MTQSGLVSALMSIALLSAAVPAHALEVRDPETRLGFVVPDGWAVATDGPWTAVDAPDHRFRGRIMAHTRGAVTDREAESLMLGLLGQKWTTYTVDQHAHRVVWASFAGVDIVGHGSGDGWDRARFHMFLVVDQSAPARGAIVWLSGRDDAWDTYHPAIDHAVRLLRST